MKLNLHDYLKSYRLSGNKSKEEFLEHIEKVKKALN